MNVHGIASRNTYRILNILLLLFITTALLFLLPSKEKKIRDVVAVQNSPFLTSDTAWASARLAKMTPAEKAGQLLMLDMAAVTDDPRGFDTSSLKAIPPGGFVLGKKRLSYQQSLMQGFNQSNDLRPLLAAEATWGLHISGDSLIQDPLLPGISCIQNDSVISELAVAVASQLKALGVTMNLALDNGLCKMNRDKGEAASFEPFLTELGRKTGIYLKAQQNKGILVCATGFPNFRLRKPVAAEASDSLLLRPFRNWAAAGLSGMIAETTDPARKAEETEMTDSLHKLINFRGLVISELDPKSSNPPGERELEALLQGSDMVRTGSRLKETGDYLVKAMENGSLPMDAVNAKVKRILLAKSWAGLSRKESVQSPAVLQNSNLAVEVARHHALVSAMVLLRNSKAEIPVSDRYTGTVACLVLSASRKPAFTEGLSHYAGIQTFQLAPDASAETRTKMLASLSRFGMVITAVFTDEAGYFKRDQLNETLHTIAKKSSLLVVHFGSASGLELLDPYPELIHSFSAETTALAFAAQAVYGGIPLSARLPLSCSEHYCYGDGLPFFAATRVSYGIPEDAGISSSLLPRMDSLIRLAIQARAFPGCQVFASCKGRVIVNKAWGNHTYDKKEEVKPGDLYDLASVTKVASTTLAVMWLYDRGKILTDTTLNYYFKDLDKNSKGKKVRTSKLNEITLRQLMTHRSGLPSALPIARFISPRWYLKYMLELEKNRMEQQQDTLSEAQEQSPEWMIDTAGLNIAEDSIFGWLFTKERDVLHTKAIGENFYMREIIIDSIWQLAKQTAVRKNKDYLYSDMNFYLVMKVVEAVSKTALDVFIRKQIYEPMHLKHITYKPLEHFKKEEIVPTEDEKIFRKQLLRGYVHDPTAALLGGVSGNAGLFSNAEDLGMLMQMLLYGGSYGGQRYFSETTVRYFTQPSEGGYRGLGWDHQTKSGMKMIAPSASLSTFGHTGFTGTCVWVDPENEIVFVFVSNRVHPSGSNQKINGMQIRQKLQQMIYDARIVN